LVRCMSNRCKRNLYVLNLGSLKDDNAFRQAIINIPSDAIVVMEDIDCMRYKLDRSSDAEKKESGPTLSSLLNFLDGIESGHKQMVVMTTNDISKLDPAILRSGRCDVKVELHGCTRDSLDQMFHMFFDEDLPLPKTAKCNAASPATIMNILAGFRDDCAAARQTILDILK